MKMPPKLVSVPPGATLAWTLMVRCPGEPTLTVR